MTVDLAVDLWRGLERMSPHGCRVHLTGGEPFLDWPRVIEIIRAAAGEGLYADSVETNGFWALDEEIICDRLGALDDAGVRCLAISADPFHQAFVPISRVRFLAARAKEKLGPQRVRVRWQDWLDTGRDVMAMDEPARKTLLAEWIASGRDRINGRAAEALAHRLSLQPAEAFRGQHCREGLLRGRHVHVGPDGEVLPGVCAGLVLGYVRQPCEESIQKLWHDLREDYEGRPILGRLVTAGPTALLELARQRDLDLPDIEKGFASKCHLCWIVRKRLAATGDFAEELGPPQMYQNET